MSIEAVVHWLIDRANVTQDEKDEQHAALSGTADAAPAPPPAEETATDENQ